MSGLIVILTTINWYMSLIAVLKLDYIFTFSRMVMAKRAIIHGYKYNPNGN